jgi:succinate dehydrogenase/fumarate reductase-like Fe-S protein
MAEEMVPVYIMGKLYEVPAGLTIMKAMEYAGYRLIRGVGCRGGFCGACATVYRIANDPKLYVGLACQTIVQPGMYLAQIPFFPAEKAVYDINQLKPEPETIFKLYPQVLRCLGCGTCTKSCPQELDGDIARVADLSFDCIMCGLCSARCPAEEPQYNIAILCRRLYGKYLAPRSKHLEERLREIQEGKFDEEMKKIKSLSVDELKKIYSARDIEPE